MPPNFFLNISSRCSGGRGGGGGVSLDKVERARPALDNAPAVIALFVSASCFCTHKYRDTAAVHAVILVQTFSARKNLSSGAIKIRSSCCAVYCTFTLYYHYIVIYLRTAY